MMVVRRPPRPGTWAPKGAHADRSQTFLRKDTMTRIVSTMRLTDRVSALELESPDVVSSAQPGQIVLTRFARDTAWVPKAIVDVNAEQGTMTLLFSSARVESESDRELEIKGPYGLPRKWDRASKMLFVAEGDGLGAILQPLREFKAKERYAIVIAGYRSHGDVFWAERLDEASDELYVVTDDGSFGIKGPVRHTLRAVCEHAQDIDRVYAVGSLKLLRTTADVTRIFNIPTTVSLAAVFDDAAPPVLPDAGIEQPAGADEAFDWAHAIDLDAHATDFDALARRLGILVTR
jgi:ferredoxin--NADP+ reductase